MREEHLIKERERVLRDIREYPENHRHDFNGLLSCCAIDGILDNSLMEAHSEYAGIGSNNGRRCDVVAGPCVCGAWH